MLFDSKSRHKSRYMKNVSGVFAYNFSTFELVSLTMIVVYLKVDLIHKS